MVSTAGGIAIAVVIIALGAAVGWVVFTQMRARRLGLTGGIASQLPPPSLSSYLPWKRSDNPFGPPRPAPGGVVGWVNDQVRKFKNRNNRSAAGAYEQPLQGGGGGGRRGFGPLDPDEAWDSRVGQEADGYGYYEEQELGGRNNAAYGGGSYNMNLASTPGGAAGAGRGDEDLERGRRLSRDPPNQGLGARNPFDDDAESSLRGVSPRPMESGPAGGRPLSRRNSEDSVRTERRSVFRENV
ncbi:acid phosphatase [Paramyrothecium foliicola]|nr:acid phosphatase [Paramyrothecium foliicola]